ncbi:FAD binding domain-containing protein [Pseudonocardia xinjiangensis]|uniref:FAD binding domain-containing protein n=1 Tax=Pseudonocardia xinjiangensis TaxID=75289 RepID=UPI0028A6E36E|nr:FAD binding domain-containing protein [Pseudonocardia xinjiangensis]
MGVDLDTVTEIRSARELDGWRPGDAWLAGGTFLFSEPQPHLTRLLDLSDMGWAPLEVTDRGLEIAATCTVAELARFVPPAGWTAVRPATGPSLVEQCCHSFVASFKIWTMATVGGNICNALPAGPMISLTAALEGTATLVAPDGARRFVPVADVVTGVGTTVLSDGELLRSVTLPTSALRSTTAFRQASLYPVGRSGALLIGRLDPLEGSLTLTVTASTVRPVQLRFGRVPDAGTLAAAVAEAIPAQAYVDDVHGLPAWRRHMTRRLAEEIRRELEEGTR